MLLESPLDKLEPYQIFRACLLSKSSIRGVRNSCLTSFAGLQQEQPQFYTGLSSHLSADEQGVIQTVVQQAEANETAAHLAAQAIANGTATS